MPHDDDDDDDDDDLVCLIQVAWNEALVPLT
jgi:hypothetical protein